MSQEDTTTAKSNLWLVVLLLPLLWLSYIFTSLISIKVSKMEIIIKLVCFFSLSYTTNLKKITLSPPPPKEFIHSLFPSTVLVIIPLIFHPFSESALQQERHISRKRKFPTL